MDKPLQAFLHIFFQAYRIENEKMEMEKRSLTMEKLVQTFNYLGNPIFGSNFSFN